MNLELVPIRTLYLKKGEIGYDILVLVFSLLKY